LSLTELADAYAEAIHRRRLSEDAYRVQLVIVQSLQRDFNQADGEVKEARDALLAEARGEVLR
jgi:hypothetical protein